MTKIIDGSELVGKKLEVQEDGTFKLVETGKFVPRSDENYWIIGVGGFPLRCNYVTTWEKEHYLLFRTKEECQLYKDFMDDYYENTREYVCDHKNFYFYLNMDKSLCIAHNYGVIYLKRYFGDCVEITKFRKKWGDDLIKKFLFDVWE